MPAPPRVCFEDFDEVGTTRETDGRTITETDIVSHAGHISDFFPLHIDDEAAK